MESVIYICGLVFMLVLVLVNLYKKKYDTGIGLVMVTVAYAVVVYLKGGFGF